MTIYACLDLYLTDQNDKNCEKKKITVKKKSFKMVSSRYGKIDNRYGNIIIGMGKKDSSLLIFWQHWAEKVR